MAYNLLFQKLFINDHRKIIYSYNIYYLLSILLLILLQ